MSLAAHSQIISPEVSFRIFPFFHVFFLLLLIILSTFCEHKEFLLLVLFLDYALHSLVNVLESVSVWIVTGCRPLANIISAIFC